jgi:hypothetical protein
MLTPEQLTARIIEIHALMRHACAFGLSAEIAFRELADDMPGHDDEIEAVRLAYITESSAVDAGYAVEELIDLAKARDRAWARVARDQQR